MRSRVAQSSSQEGRRFHPVSAVAYGAAVDSGMPLVEPQGVLALVGLVNPHGAPRHRVLTSIFKHLDPRRGLQAINGSRHHRVKGSLQVAAIVFLRRERCFHDEQGVVVLNFRRQAHLHGNGKEVVRAPRPTKDQTKQNVF